MSRFIDAHLLPVAIALGDRLGLTLWAPSWRDGSGDEVESFLGAREQVFAFSSAEELAGYLAEHPDDDLSGHPAWPAVRLRSPAELRAAPGDLVDFDELFQLLAGEPTAAALEAVSKTLQLAESIASCCEDAELLNVLDRDPYRRALAGFPDRIGLDKSWRELGGEASRSWEWVLERLARCIRFSAQEPAASIDAVRQPGPVASPWLANQRLPAQGSPGTRSAAWQPAGYPSPDEAALPSRTPTVLITLFFGLFGIIPAAVATAQARAEGVQTGRYWAAFAWTLVLSFVLWLVLVAVVAGVVLGTA